ncbi:AAA family ATPase [Myroides profundi]|uniref:Exonuclease SbcC n=1 Tax=Myroides profundi TaxID=480520 RepID=A0AAJ4W3Q0_MYRPR|nr:AAA family ATPase [Myroides profundi]AJH15840.1 hypothetical protein MPR_2674 [Myroides profundi]SEQ73625.1 exonuclease SbcC [Myroides profundi]
MKHLKKITISNARRFGKNVEIELSSGANIFLAPNGTGKTTLFEAIEFALTGSIQRLTNPPLSLIRDTQNGVDVRLDFDNGNYCEVNYQKGLDPKISGNHDLLFPGHSINDIPFLLRLTHLIEQRGNNWFIQKGESSQAGDLLDKLSIGKDLSAISKTKSNTLNAATRTINDKKDEKDKQQQRISFFEGKLEERDNAKLNYVLKPLNEIIDQVQSVHKQFDSSSNSENIDQNPDAVASYRGLVNSIILKLEEDNQKRLFNLSNLESKISLFESNNTEIAEKQKQIAGKTEIIHKANTDISQLKNSLATLKDTFNEQKDIQKDLQKSKRLLDKKKEEEVKLASTEKSIKSISEYISEQIEKLKSESELVNKLNQKIVTFNSIKESEEEALKKQGKLNSLQLVIEDWNMHLQKVTQLKEIISTEKEQKAHYEKKIEDFQTDLVIIEKLFNESQTKLNSLKNASDAILGAVGIIATNLPDDQRKCPVCNAEYEPDELSKQIALALEQIDPIISSEIETNNKLKTEVDTKKQQIQNEKTTLSKINENLVENEDKLKNAKEFINEKCIPRFPDSNNITEAKEWLKGKKEKNKVNIEKIVKDKTEFGEKPSSEELSKLITARDQTNGTIQSSEINVITLKVSLENVKTEIEKINQTLSLINTDLLDSQISTIATEIEATTLKITDNNRASEQIVKVKREVEEQITDLNMAISKLQGQQNEMLAEWKDSNLIEPPSLDNLNIGKNKLILNDRLIKKGLADLNKMSDELGRWNAAEKFATLDKEIKEICESQEEQAYLSNMRERLATINGELSFLRERKAALEKLYHKIGEEVDGVHDKIKAINPLWVSLLKKIVVNPRFMDTKLDSYSHRNKSQAKVEIKLHEKQVSVMEVASEAQATDLQLTFMLSMASTYKWTPWKSLLLDDPTQHHDLVHASGVFDLLRDYIVDQDFQVLMGTHDINQAKFFQRKLENDNIDVKLWRLVANDDGVRAELMN